MTALPRVALLGLTMLGLLAFPAGASACSCAPPAPGESRAEQLREEIRRGDGAIVGRLLSVRPDTGGPGDVWFRYRILMVVKGKPRLRRGAVVAVRSGGDGATCGLPQDEGRRYGLVLDRLQRRWWGNLCQVYGPRLMRAQAEGDGSRAAEPAGCR